ncbi:HNH endonuclease [Streptomyces sp. NPDC056061]|uniref:HNH endonuclease n=1 Tax=Streptomyces sp. NPDC056061 TaxID=3345700 RepID=UPI0035DEECE0
MPTRLAPPTPVHSEGVERRVVAGIRLAAARHVARPRPILPPMRPPEPPSGPSRRDVLRRWEELEWWSCVYCDASLGGMVVAEVDHVNPLAKGGAHEWPNLAPACRECNRAKGDADVTVWLGLTSE